MRRFPGGSASCLTHKAGSISKCKWPHEWRGLAGAPAGTQSCLQQIDKHLQSARHTSGVLEPTPGVPCPVCLGVPGSVLGGPVRAGGPREPSQPVCPVNGSLGPPSRPSADCRLLLCSGQELGMRALEPGHPLLLGSRVGGYVSRGLQCREAVCTPSAPNTSEGRSPHRAGHRGTFPPNPHRRLEGVIRLVQPGGHRDLIAGTTRGSCKGWKDVGAQRGRRRSRPGFNPPVARRGRRQSQGRLCGRRMGKAYLGGRSVQDPGTHHPLPSCERPCPAPGNTCFSPCTQDGRVSWISSSRPCPGHQTLSMPRTLT